MENIEKGSVVLSLRGNDKGKVMLVVGTDGKHVLVCDGKKRKIEFPKRKNPCHLRVLLSEDVSKAVDAELTDGVLRKYLRAISDSFYAEQSGSK